jgi:hypothetical protein
MECLRSQISGTRLPILRIEEIQQRDDDGAHAAKEEPPDTRPRRPEHHASFVFRGQQGTGERV